MSHPEAGLVDVAVRDRLTYDKDQLAALLGADEGGLAGKVASIRVTARQPEEVVP